MAIMRDIRRRIRTVRNIQQITKALKMVAAARLQRAESRLRAARPYADEMLALMSRLQSAAANGDVRHPLLEVREPVNIGILAITSDRGMAGGYNTNVTRRALDIIQPYDRDRVKLVTVGRKARAFFAKRMYNIAANFTMPSSEVNFAEARQISRTIQDLFEGREVDAIRIVYTRFLSAVRHRVVDVQLLPVAPPEAQEVHRGGPAEEYIFEPLPEALLCSLLPRYVDIQVYRVMLESLASEHSARMAAMALATDNAGEMTERLTLDFNRARQSAITKELAEIVGGAEALR